MSIVMSIVDAPTSTKITPLTITLIKAIKDTIMKNTRTTIITAIMIIKHMLIMTNMSMLNTATDTTSIMVMDMDMGQATIAITITMTVINIRIAQ